MNDMCKVYKIDNYAVQDNGIVRDKNNVIVGRLEDLENRLRTTDREDSDYGVTVDGYDLDELLSSMIYLLASHSYWLKLVYKQFPQFNNDWIGYAEEEEALMVLSNLLGGDVALKELAKADNYFKKKQPRKAIGVLKEWSESDD